MSPNRSKHLLVTVHFVHYLGQTQLIRAFIESQELYQGDDVLIHQLRSVWPPPIRYEDIRHLKRDAIVKRLLRPVALQRSLRGLEPSQDLARLFDRSCSDRGPNAVRDEPH
jgi:hypothetical protein